MNWIKLGKIFDPTNHQLPNNCLEFAASPQALVFHDFIRIYFSSRSKDESGKYLSQIVFVDFDKNLKNITDISNKTIIDLGELGCYDEHGIFPFNVLQNKQKILGYIGGWSRRVSVSVETSIGLAVSLDQGLTFTKIGLGPILSSSLHEPYMVGDPFVKKYNSTYHMWYIYGTKWIDSPDELEKQRVYKIGHAISPDGIHWKKSGQQLIVNKLNADECQALPTVIEHKGTYHMVFCFRHATSFRKNPDRAYRLGYAYSTDLINWTRADEKLGIDVGKNGEWDSEMMCYPHLFKDSDNVYLLYNGNEFGRLGFGAAVLSV